MPIDEANSRADQTVSWLDDAAWRLAAQAAPCGLFVCNPDGIFIFVNAVFEQLTGYSADQLIGELSFESLHEPQALMSRRLEIRRPAMTTQVDSAHPLTPVGPASGTDWTYLKSDGSHVPVKLTLNRLVDEKDNTRGYVGAVFDNAGSAHEHARPWQLFYRDTLTGLPGRAWMEERLELAIERAKASGEPVLLVLIELHDLRHVRDIGGEAAVRLVVEQAARYLRNCCTKGQTLGMLQDTRFAMVCTGQTHLDAETQAALLAAASRAVQYETNILHVKASVGASAFPAAGSDVPALLQRAVMALNAARQSGGNIARHFEFDMQMQSSRRRLLETYLGTAIDASQLTLVYQPQVNLQSGHIDFAEALLRWQHPVLGAVSPAEFIPLAEELGQIDALGAWVLDEACKQAARIATKFGKSPRIGINVSPLQLRNSEFFQMVESALKLRNLPPAYLEVEITEGVLLDDTELMLDTLKRLKALGVGIAIDDFGTGYSSFSYLTRLPVNHLKIDRSLVCAMEPGSDSEPVVSAIVAMAHALSMNVTAEGVETKYQADRLRELGCDNAQGYWFSRPLSAAAFENILTPLG